MQASTKTSTAPPLSILEGGICEGTDLLHLVPSTMQSAANIMSRQMSSKSDRQPIKAAPHAISVPDGGLIKPSRETRQ